TATIASRTASTRQTVSLRRMRRRSTIVSASSDIARLRSTTSRNVTPARIQRDPAGAGCRRTLPDEADVGGPTKICAKHESQVKGARNPDAIVANCSETRDASPDNRRFKTTTPPVPRGRRHRRTEARRTLLVGFLALALERGAEDVAERRARIG